MVYLLIAYLFASYRNGGIVIPHGHNFMVFKTFASQAWIQGFYQKNLLTFR
jgi:hypothetical protein